MKNITFEIRVQVWTLISHKINKYVRYETTSHVWDIIEQITIYKDITNQSRYAIREQIKPNYTPQ